jgi:hypothetical protein
MKTVLQRFVLATAVTLVACALKVTGKLEMKSNTIHIDGIEPLS